MASLRPLLERAAHDLEPQVRAQLGGLLGGFIRAYLPQSWVFRTQKETATLTVDRNGAATVAEGALEHPDVTVEASEEHLATALGSRSRGRIPPGAVRVTPHTPKGKAAFDYLRGRLGL